MLTHTRTYFGKNTPKCVQNDEYKLHITSPDLIWAQRALGSKGAMTLTSTRKVYISNDQWLQMMTLFKAVLFQGGTKGHRYLALDEVSVINNQREEGGQIRGR